MKLIKIPYNAGALSKREGVELAPDRIEEQLKDLNLNEKNELPYIEIGSIEVDNSNLRESLKKISTEIEKQENFFIAVGGDHSITNPIITVLKEKHSEIGLIIFDAHPDLMPADATLDHENYLTALIDKKTIKPENIMIIGVRDIDKQERKYITKNNIKLYTAKQIFANDIKNVTDAITEQARKYKRLYISIDIDVLDPAFAPGTGSPEPGGLSSRELLYIIQRLRLLPSIAAIDIIEVNPKKDLNNMTSKLAAKLINELS
jgi:agmatinase